MHIIFIPSYFWNSHAIADVIETEHLYGKIIGVFGRLSRLKGAYPG